MGQLLTINCCDGAAFEINKCFCWGRSSKKSDVVYTDASRSITIVQVPYDDIPTLVPDNVDVKEMDRLLFVGRDKGDIIIVGAQGMGMWSDEKEGVKSEQDMQGRTVEEVWPAHIVRFLKPMFQNTLTGGYYQVNAFWKGSIHLIRTYPVLDDKQRIIGGLCIISPSSQGDINQFEVRRSSSPAS